MNKIDQFKDEYYFLSNFYSAQVEYDGIVYHNNEAAFQAQKDLTRVAEFESLGGKDAKRLGRRVNLRADWNDVRDNIMADLIKIKFSDPELAEKLVTNKVIEANNGFIQEDNNWHDTYWGVCNGEGNNMLGKILMDTRHFIIEEHKRLPRRTRYGVRGNLSDITDTMNDFQKGLGE